MYCKIKSEIAQMSLPARVQISLPQILNYQEKERKRWDVIKVYCKSWRGKTAKNAKPDVNTLIAK